MLPTETFEEVATFLKLYELDALRMTSSRCYYVACERAGIIRAFDFSHPRYAAEGNVAGCGVQVLRAGMAARPGVCIDFPDADSLSDFLRDALRNCIVNSLCIFCRGSTVRTLMNVVDSLILLDTLSFIDLCQGNPPTAH